MCWLTLNKIGHTFFSFCALWATSTLSWAFHTVNSFEKQMQISEMGIRIFTAVILSTLLSPVSSSLVVKNGLLLKQDQISLRAVSGQFFQMRFWVSNIIFVSLLAKQTSLCRVMETLTRSSNIIVLPSKIGNPSIVFQIRQCLSPPNEHPIELHPDLIHCLVSLLQQRFALWLNGVIVRTG